ncbi:MAG TPA: helix-turn-helix domain-containing protein [Actinomycetota bacterium]|nr:helix-turn-helix domain-containing protein [Actinomycetota bacterium]
MEPALSESVHRLPAPPLRSLIASYSGYRQAGLAPALHRGLPSPFLTLIVTFDEPLTVAAHPDPHQPAGRYDLLIGGLHTAPAIVTHQGRQAGIQVALSPLGARALLGLPAAELASIDLEAGDVVGPWAAELHERVSAAGTWDERFAAVDELLLRRMQLDRGPGDDVVAAWELLLATGGAIGVADLAREVGWTPRHLGNRFAAEVGLSPKEAARVVRFDRARRRLQREGAGLSLATLAADGGYYDQAHLAREFRALAGTSPSRWREEEFRNIQAPGATAGAE